MLNRNQYFIKEHVGMLKLKQAYDILDPQTQVKIGEAREEISGIIQALRLIIPKQYMPTRIAVYESGDGIPETLLFTLKRGAAFLRPTVEVMDATGAPLGYLKSKLLSLGGAFRVFTADNEEVAMVRGNWRGWDFRFLQGENERGSVSKQWAGFGKELFTSADNYLININGSPSPAINILLLAAGLAIDTVLKEQE